MTILHSEEQPTDTKGVYSESHNCVDCGYNTAPGAPPSASEVYMVRDTVWKAAGMEPYGCCLCVGCLEKRIGRRLKPGDFPNHAFNSPNMACTERLRERRGG